jgi:hypothetical protein
MFLKSPVPGSSWTTVVDIEKAGNEHASFANRSNGGSNLEITGIIRNLGPGTQAKPSADCRAWFGLPLEQIQNQRSIDYAGRHSRNHNRKISRKDAKAQRYRNGGRDERLEPEQ